MAKYVIEDTTLTGIADAIRSKTGGTDPIAVTDMAAQIAAITGGGSAEGRTTVWAEQEVAIDPEDGFGGGPADVALVVGTTYTVKWDGAEYECVADVVDVGNGFGYPFIGNPALSGDLGAVGDDNGLPFAIGYIPRHVSREAFNAIIIYANDTNNHTVGIYTESIAVEPLLAAQTYEGFAFDSSLGAYVYAINPAPTVPVVGETYIVKWDGAFYSCVAQDVSAAMGAGAVAMGNLVPLGGTGNYEGFIVGYMSNTLLLSAFDSAAAHDVGIYKPASSSGGSVEEIVYVTFMNGDVELCKTACMKGDSTVDPVADGKIATPTHQLDDGRSCSFFGWLRSEGGEVDELALTDVARNTTLYAGFIIAKGTSGSGVAWRIYSTGLMVIDGEGAISDHAGETALANSYKQYVTQVVVKEGVTTIGENAFYGYPNLCSVTLPESVTAINNFAFMRCPALQSVNIPGGVSVIKAQTFAGCSALEHITIPVAVTQIQMNAFSSAGLTSAVFENPNGWTTTPGIFAGIEATLSAEDLSDPTTAAAYLTSGDYCDSTWNRS